MRIENPIEKLNQFKKNSLFKDKKVSFPSEKTL